MYLNKINKLLAPITNSVTDQVSMSFPVPTSKGCCVFYYTVRENEPGGMKMLEIVTAALIHADSYTQVSGEDVFSKDTLRMLPAVQPSASFSEVFQQRKKCERSIDELIAASDFDVRGFQALKKVSKDKIEQFIMNVSVYASMLEQETIYTNLLGDLYEVLSSSENEVLLWEI